MNTYDFGNIIRCSAEFKNESGEYADPDTVRLKVKDPSGSVTLYVYGVSSGFVKDATGQYHYDVIGSKSGVWVYRFDGLDSDDDYMTADEEKFEISESEF